MPRTSSSRRAALLDEPRLDLAVVVRGIEALVAIDEADGNFDRARKRSGETAARLRARGE